MRTLLDDKEWLYHQYITLKLSTIKISKIVGRSPRLVGMKLKQHGIPTRSTSEAMKQISDQISQANKTRWSSNNYREKVTNAINKTYQDQQLCERTKQCSIEYWEKKSSKSKASKSSKDKWKSKEYRLKMQHAIKQSIPTLKKKCKKATKQKWADDDYREKVTTATKKACNKQEWKEKASAVATNLWQNDEYRKKVEKALAVARARPEYKRNLALAKLKQPRTSYEERIISAILTELGIPNRKVVIGPHEFDLLVETDPPTLIEHQGEYFHKPNRSHDKSKKTYFDRYLSDKYRLVYLWDYEFISNGMIFDKIKQIIGYQPPITNINPKQLDFRQVNRSDYRDFYSKYHYIGNQGKWGYTIGGYYQDKLICCVTYSGCTRKQIIDRLGIRCTEIRELSRLCRHPLYVGKNMLSKLISKSIKMIKKDRPELKYLVTYADQSQKHTGTVYKASNWVLDGETPPSYHYEKDGYVTYKKTLWDRAKKMGMTEKQYSEKHGFARIPELPKLRYLYYL